MSDDTISIGFSVDTGELQSGIGAALDSLAQMPPVLEQDFGAIAASAATASGHLKSLSDASADATKKAQDDYAAGTQRVAMLSALNQMSTDQAIAERERLENVRFAAARAELEMDEECAVEGSKLARQIQDKAYAQEAQHNARMRQLDLQAVKQSEAAWKSMVQPIKQSFGSAIEGMITGTQSMHQALAKIGQSILSDFVHLGVQRVTNWLTSELTMTEATVAGDAARTASNQAASTASSGFSFAHALQEIESNAARVYSSVFAWAAPALGPFAVVPATAAAALVIAKEALIPSFDQGAWSLPGDMLAMVHQGETILPRAFAEDFRSAVSGGSGGGGDTHIHIHATDAQSFQRQLMNSGSTLARSLRQQARNFHPALR
jgi:hypothetical protein